jgi:hypothetical protein
MTMPFLYEHQNRHAPVRSNGRRFHGYPSRSGGVTPDLVVVHDTESVLDTAGPDTGALDVADYQSGVVRPSSYHRLVDSARILVTLPDEATAFGAKGANTRGLHVSLAMRTVDWLRTDAVAVERRERALEHLARVVAEWCRKYGIPVRRITRAQYLAGASGIVGHADVDPDRRSDPGDGFPWDRFLARVRELLQNATIPTPVQEDDMPLTEADLEKIKEALVEPLAQRTRQVLADGKTYAYGLDALRRLLVLLVDAVNELPAKVAAAIKAQQ